MNNIEKFRIFRDLKQNDIADILNITLATYRRLEKKSPNQRRSIDKERIHKLSNYYNINYDNLIK
jgi:transcriptional regulator with XRE-family HTH domain